MAPKRILSCGIVLLHPEENGYRYLLLRAFNYWDFPKGRMEDGETPMQAALREVEEETTVTQLNFAWDEVYRETRPYNRGRKVARYYIATTDQTDIDLPINPELGRAEHSEYCWATRDEVWELTTARVRSIIRWADEVMAVKKS